MTTTPIHVLVYLAIAAVLFALLIVAGSVIKAAGDADEQERQQACAKCPHLHGAHQHYRRGSDCSLCSSCREFIAADVVRARSGDLPFNVVDYVTDEAPLYDPAAVDGEYEQLCRREAS